MDNQLSELRDELERLKSELTAQREQNHDKTMNEVAESIEMFDMGRGYRTRRKLSGHLSKVYALHWNGDSRYIL